MEVVAIVVSMLVAIFLPMFFMLSGEQLKAEEEKARARRLVDAKMNARLLRFNL
jgi:hypothetical protein